MVIDDADGIHAAGDAVLGDMGKVACVGLPHFSKGILLKGLAVAHVWIAC